jgi:hypothetical protein
MAAGQLAQGHGHKPAEERRQHKAENYSRTGQIDRRGRPQKQPGSDRAADGHHGHLTGAKLMMKPVFLPYFVLTIHEALIPELLFLPKSYLEL